MALLQQGQGNELSKSAAGARNKNFRFHCLDILLMRTAHCGTELRALANWLQRLVCLSAHSLK